MQYPRIGGFRDGIHGLLLKIGEMIDRVGIGDL